MTGRLLMIALLALMLGACASNRASLTADTRDGSGRMIVVVVANPQELPPPQTGSTPRGYEAAPDYSVSGSALDAAKVLAGRYGLRQVTAWVIPPLKVYCVIFDIADPGTRPGVMAALAQDPLVKSVQPLQTFSTLGSSYNDPYVDLQRGFLRIDAAGAQQSSQGSGIKVAVIDTGIDAGHPDLKGRVVLQRNFVDDDAAQFARDRHGTEVAGIIAANANNHEGIVGIAPHASVLALKACWQLADGTTAQCNSLTLAQALVAAMEAGAQVINLSLGGPADPLLAQLLQEALARHIVVVGAVPPSGRLDGFPVGVAGVIAVDSEGLAAGTDMRAGTVLRAPGHEVITLTPGGHYDFVSGSSMAAAHVSGAVALMLGLDAGLDAQTLAERLYRSHRYLADGTRLIDVCVALNSRRPGPSCAPSQEQPLTADTSGR